MCYCSSSYRNDPSWIEAKFASKCKCGNEIKKGERIYYYPLTRTALCPKCSEAAEREFQACKADEDFYNSQY
jgi:hypothetical protein